MSFQTAPVGLVMTAIVAGRTGSGRLRATSNRPSAARRALRASKRRVRSPRPGRLDRLDVELERTLRLEQVDPSVGHDAQPGLRLEGRAEAIVAEPHALELVALVLEREVGVAGRRDRHPSDLALDPQVGQARVGADRAADRAGDLADGQDPDAERARRGGRGDLVARRTGGTRVQARRDAQARIGPVPAGRRSPPPARRRSSPSSAAPSPVARSASSCQPRSIARPWSGTRRCACRSGSCRPPRRRSGR